jgi:hypothetical protein
MIHLNNTFDFRIIIIASVGLTKKKFIWNLSHKGVFDNVPTSIWEVAIFFFIACYLLKYA